MKRPKGVLWSWVEKHGLAILVLFFIVPVPLASVVLLRGDCAAGSRTQNGLPAVAFALAAQEVDFRGLFE